MMPDNMIIVKMGEMVVVNGIKESDVILKTTLGSCIGIVLTDKIKNISGLAHIMLPKMLRNDPKIGKYADTAIPAMLTEMKSKGSRITNIKAYIVGGASMFGKTNSLLNIGEKNYIIVREILEKHRIPIIYEDTGGTYGRTLIYYHPSGNIEVKTLDALSRSNAREDN